MYFYETHEDGYCEFGTLSGATQAADEAAERDGHRIAVKNNAGDVVHVAGRNLPTHEQRCMNPEAYGYED